MTDLRTKRCIDHCILTGKECIYHCILTGTEFIYLNILTKDTMIFRGKFDGIVILRGLKLFSKKYKYRNYQFLQFRNNFSSNFIFAICSNIMTEILMVWQPWQLFRLTSSANFQICGKNITKYPSVLGSENLPLLSYSWYLKRNPAFVITSESADTSRKSDVLSP